MSRNSLPGVLDEVSASSSSPAPCPFLHKVPLEVRELIYDFYFDWDCVRIIGGGHLPCAYGLHTCDTPTTLQKRTVVSWTAPALHRMVVRPSVRSGLKKPTAEHPLVCLNDDCARTVQKMRVIGILLACRLLYVETLPILYGRSRFAFYHDVAFGVFAESLLRAPEEQPGGGVVFLRRIRLHAPALEIVRRCSAEQRRDVYQLCVRLERLARRAPALEEIEVSVDPRAKVSLLGGFIDHEAGQKCAPMLNLVLCLFRVRGLKVLRLSGGAGGLRYELDVLEELLRPIVCLPRGVEADWRKFNVGFTERMLERPYESQMG